jgi:4-amino-4-deoxy-L-arabinose transferase-like glycosyltransferase
MRRRQPGGEQTFETVRSRYDEWSRNRPHPAPAEWSPSGHQPNSSMPRSIFAAIGVGLGLLLLLLSAISFWRAWRWADFGREPAAIGFIVVGAFLVVAGVGAIAAVLNHTFRVLSPDRPSSQAHH